MSRNTLFIKKTIILLFILNTINGLAQNPLDVFKADIDSTYIKTYPNALTVKSFINSKILNLGIEDQNGDYSLDYMPNGNNSLGFGFNYKWIGFGFAFKVINPDEADRYGETDYLDLQTNFYLRKGVFDLFYQKYKGFYLDNTSAMIKDWDNQETFYLRPDIEVVSSGINYTHIFNPEKFSYISSFSQTEVQKKSAGSIILGATVNFHRLRADSSFVPKNLIYDDAFADNQVNSIKGLSTNARFGYAHTLVAKQRFFLSISLDAGLSYVFSMYKQPEDKQKYSFSVNPNVSLRFAAGYNYKSWFAGLTTSSNYQLNRSNGFENVIRIDYGYVNFVAAYRFMLKKEIWLPTFN